MHLFRRPYIFFTLFALCVLACIALYQLEQRPASDGWSEVSRRVFFVCGALMQLFSIIYWVDLYHYHRRGCAIYSDLNVFSIFATVVGWIPVFIALFFYMLFKDGFPLPL